MINSKITGIFRNVDESKILKAAEILISNTIDTFEVSYNSQEAVKQIKLLNIQIMLANLVLKVMECGK